MMNRRQALKTVALSSVAAVTAAWGAPSGSAPAPAVSGTDPFVLPPLSYPYAALEPHIDARTMEIHHGKHHAAYVAALNKAVAPYPALARKTVEELARQLDQLPAEIQTAVRNQGGGHANHTLFWKCLSPKGGGRPEGALMESITETFGSFEALQEALSKAALGQFGSGWAWLSLDADHHLVVESLPNQDSPLMSGRDPLFGIDVWEHAYYLNYQNRRADYVKAIWNVVDWQFVAARYAELVSA